jgi:hypothetical protein
MHPQTNPGGPRESGDGAPAEAPISVVTIPASARTTDDNFPAVKTWRRSFEAERLGGLQIRLHIHGAAIQTSIHTSAGLNATDMRTIAMVA